MPNKISEIQLSDAELAKAKALEERNRIRNEEYPKTEILKCGVYQDLQGQNVLILGVAQHSETEERFVVYVPVSNQLYVYQEKGLPLRLAPLDWFIEKKKGHVPKYCWVGLSPS